MKSPGIVYRSRAGTRPEAESAVLAAVYKFVLFDSQRKRGGTHDLTNKTTTEHVENGPRTTEKEKT
jgi:hypothetical protein